MEGMSAGFADPGIAECNDEQLLDLQSGQDSRNGGDQQFSRHGLAQFAGFAGFGFSGSAGSKAGSARSRMSGVLFLGLPTLRPIGHIFISSECKWLHQVRKPILVVFTTECRQLPAAKN